MLRYGHLQPSEADAMDEDVLIAVAKQLQELRRTDHELQVETVQAVTKTIANAAEGINKTITNSTQALMRQIAQAA